MKRHDTMDKMPTVRRLPDYLFILQELSAAGELFVSSSLLAQKMGILPVLVRKDIELVRVAGTPRVGYPIDILVKRIKNFLGWGASQNAVLFGVGQLGTSILADRQLLNLGLRIVAAVDTDPCKIQTSVHGVPVFAPARLEELLKTYQIGMAILCVPAATAQNLADTIVASGIRGIWNFTSACLTVPEYVVTQKEDLTTGYALLSAKMSRMQPAPGRQEMSSTSGHEKFPELPL
jgi:redox-sensing transcriptional repressor